MKKESRFIISNAIIWASLIVASALVFNSTNADVSKSYSYLLVVVIIPLWFASDQLMRRALRKERQSS